MAEQNITIKQKNSSGSYDTLYPATTVNQLSGVLPESKGGTGVTSLSAMLTAAGGARIQTGSFRGTGTSGASNPCRLTFDFVPSFFMLISPPGATMEESSIFSCWINQTGIFWRLVYTLSGTTLSWYYDSSSSSVPTDYSPAQGNSTYSTYCWLALG